MQIPDKLKIGGKNYSILYPHKFTDSSVVLKKAYSNSSAVTWEETKGFPPMEIGGVTIEIKGTDHGVKLNVSM